MGEFSKAQARRLRGALASIQQVGTEGFDHAVIMPEDVVDILLRCDCWVILLVVAFSLATTRRRFLPD